MEFVFNYKIRILNSFKDEGILKFLVTFIEVDACSLSESCCSHSLSHEKWMAQHGKVYKDAAEKERCLQIFKP